MKTPSVNAPGRRWPASVGSQSRAAGARAGSELEKALLALHAAEEMQQFWRATRRVMHAALPLHYVCLCIRPFALAPSTIFRERAPFASEEEFRCFQELSPIQAELGRRPGAHYVRMSDVVPDRRLARTEFYRRFMRPHDDRYFACLNFWAAGAFQGMIGLHRTRDHRDFTETEGEFLAGLHPHFDTVLHRILGLHRERAVRLSLEKLVVNLPIATVLLDWDLRVTFRNRLAIDLCAVWNLGPARARAVKYAEDFRLPDEIRDYCEEFKTHWVPGHARVCPLATPGGAWISHAAVPGLRATVHLLQLDAAPLSMPMFLVRLEQTVNGRTVPAEPEGASHREMSPRFACLSLREREVATLIGQGCSNDEVASRLGKSVLTVRKQLHSIYGKLDIAGRGRLIAIMR
jgi:DNA-binding CsgD family transcriptional regulator